MSFKSRIKRFALYTGASTVAMLIDLFLFIILAEIILRDVNANISILLATAVARVTSSLVNFKLSQKAFNAKNLKNTAILKFFAVICCQLLLSAGLVMLVYRFIKISKTIIKCFVDAILYFVFYKVNSRYVFKGKEILENIS